MKRITSLLLTAVLLATMLTVFAVPAMAKTPIPPDRESDMPEAYDIDDSGGHTADINNVGKWAKQKRGYVPYGVDTYYYIVGVSGNSYTAAKYEVDIAGKCSKIGEIPAEPDYFNFLSTDKVPQAARNKAAQDYPNLASGSTLSDGNIWILAVGGVVVLGGVAALVIVKKKKKKKPALADGSENKGEE